MGHSIWSTSATGIGSGGGSGSSMRTGVVGSPTSPLISPTSGEGPSGSRMASGPLPGSAMGFADGSSMPRAGGPSPITTAPGSGSGMIAGGGGGGSSSDYGAPDEYSSGMPYGSDGSGHLMYAGAGSMMPAGRGGGGGARPMMMGRGGMASSPPVGLPPRGPAWTGPTITGSRSRVDAPIPPTGMMMPPGSTYSDVTAGLGGPAVPLPSVFTMSPPVPASSGHGVSLHAEDMNKDMRTMRCRNCGDYGHIMRYCPALTCYHCGTPGHMASVCPHIAAGAVPPGGGRGPVRGGYPPRHGSMGRGGGGDMPYGGMMGPGPGYGMMGGMGGPGVDMGGLGPGGSLIYGEMPPFMPDHGMPYDPAMLMAGMGAMPMPIPPADVAYMPGYGMGPMSGAPRGSGGGSGIMMDGGSAGGGSYDSYVADGTGAAASSGAYRPMGPGGRGTAATASVATVASVTSGGAPSYDTFQ